MEEYKPRPAVCINMKQRDLKEAVDNFVILLFSVSIAILIGVIIAVRTMIP